MFFLLRTKICFNAYLNLKLEIKKYFMSVQMYVTGRYQFREGKVKGSFQLTNHNRALYCFFLLDLNESMTFTVDKLVFTYL